MSHSDLRTSAGVILDPPSWRRFEAWAVLLLRGMIGAFLVWGVWDNLTSSHRMAEFAAFLAGHGFPTPHLLAPLSVWAQFGCGLAFMSGFCVRWAGLICAFNFLVALVMVDAQAGVRGAFPSACLFAVGLLLAARGGGCFSLDARLFRPI